MLDKKSNLDKNHPLARFKVVADAVSALFSPHVEVVLHEIVSDRVFYIAGPFSGRKAGDTSLLGLTGQDLTESHGVIGPYDKAGEKGQRIRSVTAVLRDRAGKALGLMCINLDFTVFEPALDLLSQLIRPPGAPAHPELLFQNDWREQIKQETRAFLCDHNLVKESLPPKTRRALMAALDSKGLFFAKNSVAQVAAILGVSRATAYSDLKAVKKARQTPGLEPQKGAS